MAKGWYSAVPAAALAVLLTVRRFLSVLRRLS